MDRSNGKDTILAVCLEYLLLLAVGLWGRPWLCRVLEQVVVHHHGHDGHCSLLWFGSVVGVSRVVSSQANQSVLGLLSARVDDRRERGPNQPTPAAMAKQPFFLSLMPSTLSLVSLIHCQLAFRLWIRNQVEKEGVSS